MALVLVLAPFVCGRSLKKRRVDQHKRMQLIPEPRWLVPPCSAHCNRPLLAQWQASYRLLQRLIEKQHASEMPPQKTTCKFSASHLTLKPSNIGTLPICTVQCQSVQIDTSTEGPSAAPVFPWQNTACAARSRNPRGTAAL
jgi:hypothetical protein